MGLLRLLLALAVVAAHAGPPGGIEALLLTGGPFAVQIFYVISGFYMALILNEKYTGKGAYARFARNRLLRLLPMFLVVLAATIAIALVLWATTGRAIDPLARWREHGPAMPWRDVALLWLANVGVLGQDAVTFFAVDPQHGGLYFTPAFHREPLPAWQFLWVPQAWSISVELLFYALAPFVVRRSPWLLIAGIAASLLLRVVVLRTWGLGNDPWTYRFFPHELALFLAGALSWHGYCALGRAGLLRPWACRAATAVLLLLVLGFTMLPAWLQAAPYGVPRLAFVVAALLPWAFHATREHRFDRAVGELSYPVYLVHYLFVFVVAALGIAWLDAARGIVVMALSLLGAWLLWRFVGLPIESRRQVH